MIPEPVKFACPNGHEFVPAQAPRGERHSFDRQFGVRVVGGGFVEVPGVVDPCPTCGLHLKPVAQETEEDYVRFKGAVVTAVTREALHEDIITTCNVSLKRV